METVRYKVGTANIDVVDSRKKQLVWEGLVGGQIDRQGDEGSARCRERGGHRNLQTVSG